MASPEGQAASLLLAEDEKAFCHTPKMSAFLTREHVVFDYTK